MARGSSRGRMFRLGLRLLGRSRPYSSSVPAGAKPLWGAPPVPSEGQPQIEVTINGQPVKVPPGTTIMQASASIGVDIPRFCYHERLKIAGNCRMCLVQVNGGPKLQASCAAPVAPKMAIETESAPVKKAREGVMEFILANHPLDCPICDQGGECDLQEQAMAFGSDRSRFRINVEDKRAVENKNFGPLVKTSMNRCIQCTRCVRFANEVAGVDDLGTSGRGNDMQIGTYIEKTLDSELSGNVIDLCPVGALTSKPYAYVARPWELRKTESIDVMDAVGSNIRVDSRGPEVMRVLPRLNESINEEWLGDKSRYACDGLRQQRLTVPLVRRQLGDGKSVLVESNWEEALLTAATRIRESKTEELEAILGPFADMETTALAKQSLQSLGCHNFYFDGGSLNAAPLPNGPLTRFNAGIAGIESADAILIIGSNPRKEAPIVNARIRKAYLRNPELQIGLVGELPVKGFTYEVDHLGTTVRDLSMIKSTGFWSKLKNARRPAIIVGQSAYDIGAFGDFLGIVKDLPNLIQPSWNGYSYLPLHASRTGALALGWAAKSRRVPGKARTTILLGADEISPSDLHPEAFVIYLGHHGDRGAQLADLVLPGCAYTEKDASWMNMEGRVQRSRTAVPPPGDSRPDWQVIRALAEVAGVDLGVDSQSEIGLLVKSKPASNILVDLKELAKKNHADPKQVMRSSIQDYYLTDCISRASPTMAACSQQFPPK